MNTLKNINNSIRQTQTSHFIDEALSQLLLKAPLEGSWRAYARLRGDRARVTHCLAQAYNTHHILITTHHEVLASHTKL